MSDWAELKRLAEAARIEGPVKTGADCDYATAAHPENILALIAGYEKLRAELSAIKAGQGVAVAPYGYLREVDGNVQLSIGALRPADRSGGIATPWAAIFAAQPASANARVVPVELLAEAAYWLGVHSSPCSIEQQLADELRALLAQSESEG